MLPLIDEVIRDDCLAIARADVAARKRAQMSPGNVTIRSPSEKAFGGKYWFTTGWEEGAIMADGARAVVAMLESPGDAEHARHDHEPQGELPARVLGDLEQKHQLH